jgi:predicted dehydrogenase
MDYHTKSVRLKGGVSMPEKLTKQTLGVAIVGTGFIGPAHLEALRRNAIRVIGLVETSHEAASKKAVELGIPRAYATFEEMLADPQVHVVHLATPHYLHFSQAKAALLAGKHVFCEKPLAMTSTESAELVDLASQTGLVNAVNFNLRFYPLIYQARSMVQNGDLGVPFILQGSYNQDWLLYPTDYNWRLDPDLGGKLRVVGDIGSHWLDLLCFITGLKVKEVFADLSIFHPIRKKPNKPVETYTGEKLTPKDYTDQPIVTEDYAAILLRFQNGARGSVTLSQVSAGRKNRLVFEINGSKSSIFWDSTQPEEMWIGHRDDPNQIILKDPSLLSQDARSIASLPGGHVEGFSDTFKQLQKKYYEYILAGDYQAAPDFPTFADGHYELLLNEAIERSARAGRWEIV